MRLNRKNKIWLIWFGLCIAAILFFAALLLNMTAEKRKALEDEKIKEQFSDEVKGIQSSEGLEKYEHEVGRTLNIELAE